MSLLDTTDLSRLWQSDPRNQCRYPNLTLTPIGAVLGAGTLIIKAISNHGRPSLEVAGKEEEILALLSATYGEAISPDVIPHFRGVARWLEKGDSGTACIALARSGLPTLPRWSEAGQDASERLFKAGMLMATHGVTPSQLMVWLGLLPRGVSAADWRKMAKDYNPDEERDERGRWTDGGINGAVGTSAASQGQSNPLLILAGARNKMSGEQLEALKEKFVDDHLKDAEEIAHKLGVPVENILGLSAFEGGWGTDKFAATGNNYFSMHYPAPYAIDSQTSGGGTEVSIFANYRDSALSFAQRCGDLIRGVKDPEEFLHILQDHGYYGIAPDGSKVKEFVPEVSKTIRAMRVRIQRRTA